MAGGARCAPQIIQLAFVSGSQMATHSLSVDDWPVNYKTIRLKKQVNACLPVSFLWPAVPNVTLRWMQK